MRLRRLGLLVLVAALTLGASSLSLGCSSGDSGGVQTYTDSEYGFSFDYPGDWDMDKSDAVQGNTLRMVTISDPAGALAGKRGVDGVVISLYKLENAFDESKLGVAKAELEQSFAALQEQDETWETIEPLTETTIAGLPGYTTTGSFDLDAATPAVTTYYLLFDGLIEYQIVVQAAADNWEADQAVFAAFLTSFKPGTSAN